MYHKVSVSYKSVYFTLVYLILLDTSTVIHVTISHKSILRYLTKTGSVVSCSFITLQCAPQL